MFRISVEAFKEDAVYYNVWNIDTEIENACKYAEEQLKECEKTYDQVVVKVEKKQ